MNKNVKIKIDQQGTGFCSLLCLIFVTLKLMGQIDWSWIWVLSPIWIPFTIALVFVLLAIIIVSWNSSTKEDWRND